MSLDWLKNAKFADSVVGAAGLRFRLAVDLEAEAVDLEFGLELVLGKTSFDYPAVVEHQQYCC